MVKELDFGICLEGLEEDGWTWDIRQDDSYAELYAPSGWVFNSETELQVDDFNDPEISDEEKERLRREETYADAVFECIKMIRER